MDTTQIPQPPGDRRALIAVDLGAESCRVSLLRWVDDQPSITLVHRFGNAPCRRGDGTLRWPLKAIVDGVEDGLRRCAAVAHEGVRSIAVDGWAVDYVRLDRAGEPVEEPFCYRDPRTHEAELELHQRITPTRLRELTGIQLQPLNTLYQLRADRLQELSPGQQWLHLPEYLLHRWGGAAVAELTMATHTGMVELGNRHWSGEILAAAELDVSTMPPPVPPGTLLGPLRGTMSHLPAFQATELIAPACHDTASAVAGIPASGEDWAYLSSGTWSLVGRSLASPCNSPAALNEGFTNLAGVGNRVCFHCGVNGMWLLRQCLDAWMEAGHTWGIAELLVAAEQVACPEGLLQVDDPGLLLPGDMPQRICQQRVQHGQSMLDTGPGGAPVLTRLILESLAARYAEVLRGVVRHTGKPLQRVYVVGGGSRNDLLRRLTAEATGLEVVRGPVESSTIGNFAVQLAALESSSERDRAFAAETAAWARWLGRAL